MGRSFHPTLSKMFPSLLPKPSFSDGFTGLGSRESRTHVQPCSRIDYLKFMIEQETTFIDHFRSDVGEFISAFTTGSCELRYATGSRTFSTRDAAHAAIARQTTGFAAWDELPKPDAERQAFDKRRWERQAFTHTRCEQGERLPIGSSEYPSIPPTSPPHQAAKET